VKYGKYFEVDISYCNLNICPAGIGSLGIYIVTLNLSNNRLTAVPSEIGSLLSLEELFLQYNHIMELPVRGNINQLICASFL
jgi:Leucine-rich repeat (LRR) protein